MADTEDLPGPPEKKYRILILDDDQRILNILSREMKRRQDWDLETFTSAEDALRLCQVTNFDLFISDYRMPSMNGVDFLRRVKELQPDAVRIILSGQADLKALVAGINEAEIYRYVSKPWNEHELQLTIRQALDYRDMRLENAILLKQVREQREQLREQQRLLARLERDNPGITRVPRTEDGFIPPQREDL